MAKSIKPGGLAKAIEQQLTIYHKVVTEKVDTASEEAMKQLVQRTKATAPKDTGDYVRHISSEIEEGPRGNTYIWYVKDPEYRLTHLITKTHAHRRTANPFLQNAVEEVIPEYEQAVEEAVQNG